jgi:hypothetical protein
MKPLHWGFFVSVLFVFIDCVLVNRLEDKLKIDHLEDPLLKYLQLLKHGC